MDMTGNTILITGGGSGIGRALAEAFHQLGNQVVIAGRRQDALDAVTAAHPGMRGIPLDLESAHGIQTFAEHLLQEVPSLNVVIHNAGVMINEDLKDGTTEAAETTVTTNLLGPMRLTAALIGHLLEQPHAAILTVTSGIAYSPWALTPAYSATKAGLHAYTQTLRYQLQDTAVQVIELIPPFTQTELQGPQQATNPHALPLADYIRETMQILSEQPDAEEVVIERVKLQRYAERRGESDALFKSRNDAAYGR
ncbi:SDR family NAD(P)-dependent oxidoreductase [Deinococcus sp. HMF7620]|uniref:SDR family NAD(P)-dependent oxidoreductase n=1 Tax=Deinococcus arboris TaxID=2682977 RepID=A0A7C9MPJ5_9DEIO|nr:SDR family NAD(P)-dependent oxidoreductase [Deinococcus arboris]MVN85644.1 SDR family NAD(P)-dependent oxidoreductase [Deinococcus arboris]